MMHSDVSLLNVNFRDIESRKINLRGDNTPTKSAYYGGGIIAPQTPLLDKYLIWGILWHQIQILKNPQF
jgi:hypothetical protein